MSSKFPIGVATIERPLIVLFILYKFIFIISCTPVNLSKQDPKIFQENIPPKKQIVDKSKNNIVEKTEYQEEIIAVGDIGKIEAFVPSNSSGKNSSEVRIGFRKDNVTKSSEVKVDKEILEAGHHHGSTYFEHLAFINAVQNNRVAQVSLRDGLMSVAIGEAAEISIKENRVVFMEEFKL